MPFPLASQSSRETSIASASTASSSVWEPTQPALASYGSQQQQQQQPPHMGVSTPVMNTPTHGQYSSPGFQNAAPARHDAFIGQQHSSMMGDPRHTIVTTQPMTLDGRPAMGYQFSLPSYGDPTTRNYGPSGGNC